MTIKNTRTRKVKRLYDINTEFYFVKFNRGCLSFTTDKDRAKVYSNFSLRAIRDLMILKLHFDFKNLVFKKTIELNWSIKGKALVEQVKPKEVE